MDPYLQKTSENQLCRDAVTGNTAVQTVSITAGKGGVGKTCIAVNLALALAKQGKRVMLLDADLGLANVDIILGLQSQYTLTDVLEGRCALEDIILEGPHGLHIIPSSSGIQRMSMVSKREQAGLIRAFNDIAGPLDFLIVDIAAGISDFVVSFTRACKEIVMVVCNEPTSITDAYAMIKYFNQVHHINEFKILANMIQSPEEGHQIFKKLCHVTDKFLDVGLGYLGSIPHDTHVKQSIQRRKPLIDLFPDCKASSAFMGISKKVMEWPILEIPTGRMEFFLEKVLNDNSLEHMV